MKLLLRARQRYAELHAAGVSYPEMSRELGVSERVLYLFRREMHLPRRKRGDKPGHPYYGRKKEAANEQL